MPYAPNVSYHGDEYLNRAIASAGHDLGQGIAQGVQNYKATKAAGKAADAMYSYFDTMTTDEQSGAKQPNPFGAKEFWETLGPADKAARVKGVIQAQAMQAAKQSLLQDALKAQQEQQLFPLRKQEMEGRIADQTRENEGATALQTAIGDAGFRNNTGYGGFPSGQPPAMNGGMLLEAIGRNPAAVNAPSRSVGGTMLNDLLRNEAQKRSSFFQPDETVQDIPGMDGYKRVITGPNTSEVRSVAGSEVNAVPIMGGGNVLGYGIPGRNGVMPMKTTDASKGEVTPRDQFKELQSLHRSYIANAGKALTPEQQQYWQGLADQTAQEMNSLVGTRSTASPKAEPALAMPKEKKALVKGKLYNTARGVARWDGSQFVAE